MEHAELTRILTKQLTSKFQQECARNRAKSPILDVRRDSREVIILTNEFLLSLHLWFSEYSLLDEETQDSAVSAIRLGGYRSQDLESFYAWKVAVTDSDNLAQAVRFCRAIEEIYEGKESYEPAQSS